jgi:hypothetical protein
MTFPQHHGHPFAMNLIRCVGHLVGPLAPVAAQELAADDGGRERVGGHKRAAVTTLSGSIMRLQADGPGRQVAQGADQHHRPPNHR